ncbi:SET domain-containing protein 3 [Pleosporales sp. CAS-2024a]
MTDVSSVKAHAEPQPAPSPVPNGTTSPAYSTGSPFLDGHIEEEESSTIKCICGFADDDGNTVLCERCDTWQHIVCYYESAQHVPDVHECADCAPRPVDKNGASEKQRQRREMLVERKGRPKPTAKHPKKRIKDASGAVQPNGWPSHATELHYNPERKSGSPRDQPPPNKRPKTSHRTSNSVSISQPPALAPASRKRGASIMLNNGHSPVKSPTNPDGSMEEFSSEFMTLYRQSEPASPDSNSYTDIGVANDISTWLTDPDALADASGGKKPHDLFSRIDQPLHELGAPSIAKQIEIDSGIVAHGQHPQWQFITVDEIVAEGGYIGELKGLVGRKEDYFADPLNRWDLLRHPEPFVFFPPHLPIYIDVRREGNILRYARRSCAPNMHMKIFIESSNEFHFCFLASRQIDPGEELTVGWDIDSEVFKQLAKVVTNGAKDGFRKIQPWASCVLANFGGCACDASTGHECLLERARRNTIADAPKTKGKKTKKLQISPLSTGRATNSRAGSEAMNQDAGGDDDQADVRSTSGSHKSSSRDHTPATHFSTEGDLKMSEREKRKLQQQEKLFKQMDFDADHKGKKGKRNSAGSALNTPSLSSAVRRFSRVSLHDADVASQKRLGHPEPSPSARHREHSHGVARKTSGSSTKTNGRSAPQPKPVYKEASTQTEEHGPAAPSSCPRPRDMKPPMSFKRKLLQQAQEDKLQRERLRSTSVKMERKSPALVDVASTKPSPLPPSPPLEQAPPSPMDTSTGPSVGIAPREPTPAKETTPPPVADVVMEDAEVTTPKPTQEKVEDMADALASDVSPRTSNPVQNPPAPPWPASTSATETPSKSTDSHMGMPAKLDISNPAVPAPMIPPGPVTNVLTGNAAAQSPTGLNIASLNIGSPFSPAVNNAVNPIPARKKLSLSDYTSRRAKLAQTHSTGSNSTPPLAASQSTSSPTLSTASLPGNNSPLRKSVEPALPSLAEEGKPSGPTVAMGMASTSTST